MWIPRGKLEWIIVYHLTMQVELEAQPPSACPGARARGHAHGHASFAFSIFIHTFSCMYKKIYTYRHYVLNLLYIYSRVTDVYCRKIDCGISEKIKLFSFGDSALVLYLHRSIFYETVKCTYCYTGMPFNLKRGHGHAPRYFVVPLTLHASSWLHG